MKEPHAKSKDKIAQEEEKSKGEVNLTPEEEERRRRFLEIRQALKDPEKRKEWEVRQYARWLDARVKPEEKKKEETQRTPTEIERYYAERLVNSITRKKTANRYFLRLATKRKLYVNPLRLSEEAKNHILYHSQKGTTAPAYVFLVINSDGKPTDAGLVRTYPTLKKIDTRLRDEGKRILLHPQEIRIPEGFWQRWKTARTPQDRLRLIKEYQLLTDKAVRTIDKIVLDVDTPYEKAFPKVLRIFQSLGIDRGYEIGRTKSGNLRAVIYLTHTIKAQKDFRKNKHIERLREAYYLLVELFRRHELKLDRTFADRINHPVWFSFDNRFYRRESRADGTVDFYGLYRNIKKWQSQNQVWEVENMNLTQKFWEDKRASKGKKKVPIQLPAFIRNELRTTFDEDYKLALWKKAVKSLYKGKGFRFQRFILPAIGWAKYLDLDRLEVDRYLEGFLSDRDPQKTEKDLRTAWRTAREFEFNLPERKGLPATDLVEITEKALEFVRDRGQVERQELIAEVFGGQKWLCDMVMDFLEKKGFVKSEVLKDGRIGRPPKVYRPLPVELDYDKSHEIEGESLANILTPPMAEYPLGVGGLIIDPSHRKTISVEYPLVYPPTQEIYQQDGKIPTGTQKTCQNGHTHTHTNAKVSENHQEICLTFLRELRDEELVRLREIVSRYETPDGIELILEVGGQRVETGLKVSLAIAQQKELRGLGVEVVPPVEVVPEETHEEVPPVEEVPLSAPTVPVPEAEEVPEKAVPPAPAVPPAEPKPQRKPDRTQAKEETANNHRKTHKEKEELGILSTMANRQQEKLTAQALRERFLREKGHEIQEFLRRLPKELPTTQGEFLEVMEKLYREWKAWTGDDDYWYFYAETKKTWELHHFALPSDSPLLEVKFTA